VRTSKFIMCGRTCCTLSPDLIPMACSAVTGAPPRWKDAPDGGKYYPSTNIPPSKHTPILCRGDQVRWRYRSSMTM
jgi:hypothetical protein